AAAAPASRSSPSASRNHSSSHPESRESGRLEGWPHPRAGLDGSPDDAQQRPETLLTVRSQTSRTQNLKNNPMQSSRQVGTMPFGLFENRLTRRANNGQYVIVAKRLRENAAVVISAVDDAIFRRSQFRWMVHEYSLRQGRSARGAACTADRR